MSDLLDIEYAWNPEEGDDYHTNVFDIHKYTTGTAEVAMHCSSLAEARVFLKYLDSQGYEWNDGASYEEFNHWDRYEEYTCYCFTRGTYGPYAYFKDRDIKILEFDDFDWSEWKWQIVY